MSSCRSSALLKRYYQDLFIELAGLRNSWQELYLESAGDPKLSEVNDVYIQPVIKDGAALLNMIGELA